MAKLTFKLAGVKLHIPDARLRFRVRKGGTVRSLTLEEFGEHLRVKGGPDSHWGGAVLELCDQVKDYERIETAVDTHLPASGMTYEKDVEQAGKALADVRALLVEAGALAADDTETALPDLVRALLS